MQFYTPRYVEFGRGSIEKLERYIEGKALIVSGENVWNSVEEYVSIETEVHIFKRRSDTEEPEERDIEKLAYSLSDYSPRTIIAIGGGSIIDSTKLAWIFYEHPKIGWSEIYQMKIPQLRKKAKLIAVETTSGTGTGVSAAAVVTDKNRLKRGIVNHQLIVDVSIYDPALVMSMPRKTVIYSGMDALTHAIESYTSNIDNMAADAMSFKAIDLIYHNLEKSVDGDEKARELVHYGNMLAGFGFTNSRLGLCHAASHKIGGRYKMEHGKVNAILLPYHIRYNERYTQKFKDVAKLMGVEDVAIAVRDLNERLGIPDRIELKELDKIAEEIKNDPLMNYNPRKMGTAEIKEFLQSVVEGRI